MAKKLGKGLSDLLANIENVNVPGAVSTVEADGERVYEIDIEQVFANPRQPRKYFGENELVELENSIRVHGIIQPLILVKSEDGEGYMIVAGERRWRAAREVGLKSVPAVVKRLNERNIREISLIENLQREDLNAIEEAEALRELAQMYDLSQEELAARIGKARSSVTNTLRLLQLEEDVQDLVRRDRLSAGHARALVAIKDPETQKELAFRAADEQMSVRELEQKVQYVLHPELRPQRKDPTQRAALSLELRDFVARMNRTFATKTKLVGNENKGRIYIDYFTNDDLQRIYKLIERLQPDED